MGREIKFRGKNTVNGEWVFGSLVNNLWTYSELSKYPKGTKVCEIITNNYDGDCWEDIVQQEDTCIVSVIPETVGQYTGAKDANGNELYEDDIFEDDYELYTIYWCENMLRWDCISLGSNDNINLCEFSNIKSCFKKGNYFDNPELLTQ